MADIGGGFLENRHGQFVKDDGAMTPYFGYGGTIWRPYVAFLAFLHGPPSAIDNIVVKQHHFPIVKLSTYQKYYKQNTLLHKLDTF